MTLDMDVEEKWFILGIGQRKAIDIGGLCFDVQNVKAVVREYSPRIK